LSRHIGHRTQQQREANREDPLLPTREHAPAKIQRSQSRFFQRHTYKIVRHQAYFLRLLGRGPDGFAELAEAEHGRITSIARRILRKSCRNCPCARPCVSHKILELKRFSRETGRPRESLWP